MRAFFAILACLPCVTLAGSPSQRPDGDEIKRVLEYYYGEASAAPVLVESKLCTEIATEGELKNECMHEIQASAIQPGTGAYLWMNFMVPQNAPEQKILIQFDHAGITRQTHEATLRGAIRYRTWRKFQLDRKGPWTIKILHDAEDGAREIERIDLSIGSLPLAKAAVRR